MKQIRIAFAPQEYSSAFSWPVFTLYPLYKTFHFPLLPHSCYLSCSPNILCPMQPEFSGSLTPRDPDISHPLPLKILENPWTLFASFIPDTPYYFPCTSATSVTSTLQPGFNGSRGGWVRERLKSTTDGRPWCSFGRRPLTSTSTRPTIMECRGRVPITLLLNFRGLLVSAKRNEKNKKNKSWDIKLFPPPLPNPLIHHPVTQTRHRISCQFSAFKRAV